MTCGPLSTSSRMKRLLARLRSDCSGVAMTEFAFAAPLLLLLGLAGADTANFVITHMRVSQIALHVADNASRVGEHNVLISRKVYEEDVNDVFFGAVRYGGGLDLAENGRIVLSSLEVNEDGGQWIHWQRCFGDKEGSSRFGEEGTGASGTSFPGMGAEGQRIQALEDQAVMFVEVSYDYTPISPVTFLKGREIFYTGAYNVRDVRDLSQIYQTTPPAPVNSCA